MPRSHSPRLLWAGLALPLALCAGCKNAPGKTGIDSASDSDTVGPAGSCATTFRFEATGDTPPDQVALAGVFNDWDSAANPLTEVSPGVWEGSVDLPPGAHPYKFVEITEWSMGEQYEGFVCDPEAELVHCEVGYKEPWDMGWTHECGSGTSSSCNSMVVVPDCNAPQLELEQLSVDRSAGTASLSLAGLPGNGGEIVDVQATLDGNPTSLSWSGTTGSLSLTGLSSGRHTVRIDATDASGNTAEQLYVPLWMDAAGEAPYREGSIYFAFVDRFANGDLSIDGSEGATAPIADYMGGDFQGVTAMLDYLDDLGVRTIWLSNPQDNTEGAWAGDCDGDFAGYHAYWPDQARAVEEHFGTEADLHALVDGAHARGMRVIMDWVANHVHETHPYAANAEWFNELAVCKDSSGGQSNWDRIPEECWFAPYLPDIDYSQPEILHLMVEDALWWVKTYDLDGLRVDAVKHMPHAVVWNLEERIRREIEHREAGGDTEFWTVGETFDGIERIQAYITTEGRPQLDGQFDFPLYYAVNSAFGERSITMYDLDAALLTSEGAWGGALMSSFLGNHDVMRFTSVNTEGWQSSCEEGVGLRNAGEPWDSAIYGRMRLAWTFLFTQDMVPLVYYGDEFGLPGYTDPDNRQPLWWRLGAVDGGSVGSVEEAAAEVGGEAGEVARHVGKLGRARRDHPAFWRGERVQWWIEDEVWAYARVDPETGDQMLAVINRSDSERWLTNGLAFAGLTPGAVYVDVLTDEENTASGDEITVYLPPMSSRVYVLK